MSNELYEFIETYLNDISEENYNDYLAVDIEANN